MDFMTIIKSISENGMGVVLLCYFLVKDWKQTNTIVTTLNEVATVLNIIKDKIHLENKGSEEK